MCLKVFVRGDDAKYNELKDSAMSLGSAFQKVNFLRDLKADFEDLSRTYFPNTDLQHLDETSKQSIISDIENDFSLGLEGIKKLPLEARFGVFMAYRYYNKLLEKLKKIYKLSEKYFLTEYCSPFFRLIVVITLILVDFIKLLDERECVPSLN